jgi:hypothetical protein
MSGRFIKKKITRKKSAAIFLLRIVRQNDIEESGVSVVGNRTARTALPYGMATGAPSTRQVRSFTVTIAEQNSEKISKY